MELVSLVTKPQSSMANRKTSNDLSSIFLLMWTLASTCCQDVHSATADCVLRNYTLTCDHQIPTVLPNGVKEVYIIHYVDSDPLVIPDNTNWNRITKLDITLGSEANETIQNNTFIHLVRLQILGIHGNVVRVLEPHAFMGLTNIEQLDFSECGRLDMGVLLPALENGSFRSLSILNLHGLRSCSAFTLVFDQEFLEFLAKASVTYLDISGTNVLFSRLSWPRQPLELEVLQASNITIIHSRSVPHFSLSVHILFSKVKLFNMSNINGRYEVLVFEFNNTIINVCHQNASFQTLEAFYANNDGNEHKSNFFNNVTLNIFGCLINLKTLHMRGNNIRKLNATLNWPDNMMQDFDVSDNHMEYISPAWFGDLNDLKILLLANNSLHNMQRDKEFGLLIVSCEQLQQLSLAQNSISHIPKDMFKNNWKLRDLDLSNNWLETIHFDLKMLVHLERLHLNGNKIKQLDAPSMKQLLNVLDLYSQTETRIAPVIDLEDNPFVCSCDSVKSVQWLVRHLITVANGRYRCTLEDKTVDINKEAVEYSEYLCRRTTIIVVSSITSCAVTCIVVMVTICIVKKIRKKHQMDIRDRFLHDFKVGNLKHGDNVLKRLAFISHCSADLLVVVDYIYNEMDRMFREILQVDRDTVAYGDKCFRPGFAIVTETMQCLSESCVVIFVISRSFCQSNWCQMEVNEAYEQQKPILLIFTEHVEENLMSPFLLKIYRRYTRAKITRRDDQYVLEPTWEVFCNSVITLASMDAHNKLRVGQEGYPMATERTPILRHRISYT